MKNIFKIRDKELSAVLRTALGILLIFIGIIGIFMIIMPGWPFVFLGSFIILGKEKTLQKILKYTPQKYKKIVKEYFNKIFKEK